MHAKRGLTSLCLCAAVGVAAVAGLGSTAAEAQTSNAATQIAAATLPLPEHLRAGAGVLLQADDGSTTVLRKGVNGMVCVNATTRETFLVYCEKEAFVRLLQRAAQLARQLGLMDMDKPVTDAVEREITGGRLTLPRETSVGFAMMGPLRGYNPATNTANGDIKAWQVVRVPYATGQTSGLPEQRTRGMPWVMHPGTWMAHIMIEH